MRLTVISRTAHSDYKGGEGKGLRWLIDWYRLQHWSEYGETTRSDEEL